MLDKFIEQINNSRFLPEFMFVGQKVKVPEGEIEFADCAISFDDKVAIYQLKQRDKSSIKDSENEYKWFESKVINRAKQQIKDSVRFFNYRNDITLENLRGHKINLKSGSISETYKIIIYEHSTVIALNLKHYKSSTVGFIHIFDSEDYNLVCEVLNTPAEIFEYLAFREKFVECSKIIHPVTEKCILGVFLQFPSVDDLLTQMGEEGFDALVVDLEGNVDNLIVSNDYEIGYILESFSEKLYTDSGEQTSYYKILTEVAKLNRTGRRAFKERWEKCSRHVIEKGDFILPFRIICPSSKCGFIFVPIEAENFVHRKNILANIINLNMYDTKIDKCVGIIFCYQKPDVYVDYGFIEMPWEYNAKLEEMLKEDTLFRPIVDKSLARYNIKTEN